MNSESSLWLNKQNLANLFVLAFFLFALLKLSEIIYFTEYYPYILLSGASFSLITFYILLARKQFPDFKTFALVYVSCSVLNVGYYVLYESLFQLSDVDLNFKFLALRLILGIFPASLLYLLFKFVKAKR